MNTPWRRVFARLDMSQSELARRMRCGRAKINKALASEPGYINGRDQERLMRVAREAGVEIPPEDFLPDAPVSNDHAA